MNVDLTIPVPARMEALPRWHGMPVPWMQYVDPAGVPDFKVIDEERLKQAVKERLCGLCGGHIEGWVAFIGGPKSSESRMYAEGPFHKSCAMYASSACPFVAGTIDSYAATQKVHGDDVDHTFREVPMANEDDKRTPMFVYVARDYAWANARTPDGGSQVVLLAKPGGQLTKVGKFSRILLAVTAEFPDASVTGGGEAAIIEAPDDAQGQRDMVAAINEDQNANQLDPVEGP